MYCPCCETSHLKRERLDQHLAVHACETCEGQWVSSYDYWHWLEWQPSNGKIKHCDALDISDRVSDNRRASFCPECNHLMRRAKVGHGLEFYLDRCSHCGGIWFDRGEWDILQVHNIHNKVHLVFSEPWQSQIRQAEFNRVLEETYRSALGDEDYAQALRIRSWLEQHPHRDYILSVLNQVPPSEDESRYIPVPRSVSQNDVPKEEASYQHPVASGQGHNSPITA
ncbi:zf-TFIIB domain-containing protein [Leptolyngbya cf. ectocarpi LEGE 11479]|uniref:Zf-TFIIB domain-containing protein n=1 Tax=Leptolyngbya cf. ectocarpi LEGE 11479 TaxID=1828722 RepID=A0A928ZSZ9_LEPEC|nr:zf-TFIIB domain-containing protein [Leptolyngbya ectocarpi]MBE9066101.1 zf-TFIIB domain-containing protein [Leptolyngbya cf. ectocarpi LEGE 11479]